MLNSINNILKPKSKEDISKEISKMTTYEFLYKFYNFETKGLKIGFKKKFMHFLIYSKGLVKYHKYYWIIWGIWFLITIFSFIFPDSFFQKEAISLLKDILWYFILIYFLFMLMVLFVHRKFHKYQLKQQYSRIDEINLQLHNLLNHTYISSLTRFPSARNEERNTDEN